MVAAAPITFAKADNPYEPGQLRTRTWRMPVMDPNAHLNPIWMKRVHEYWERQERKFGFVASEPGVMVDDMPDIGPVLTTTVTVLAVMPGDRT